MGKLIRREGSSCSSLGEYLNSEEGQDFPVTSEHAQSWNGGQKDGA